jgi:hypothetical protein
MVAVTPSVTPLLPTCYFESGDAAQALECAYTACQEDYGNPMALVIKAKCHLALNDIEAAFLSSYRSYNSHQL